MKRRLAVLLACALLTCAVPAFSQPSRPDSRPLNTPDPWVVDAIVLDSSGRPVADLTAADFELLQGGGARKISSVTWFDTRLHTSATRAALLPALDLLPDEIHLNLVVLVDDLGLPPAGISAVSGTLRTFVTGSMSPGDRVAILRTSEGSGAVQAFTGDKRILLEAIDAICYLGGGVSPAASGSAAWLTMVYALHGLREFPGRKAVVLFTMDPGAVGALPDAELAKAGYAAHAAAAAVYALNPLPDARSAGIEAPGALPSLVRDTGGSFATDFAQVLRNEQGYYAIGFQPGNEDSLNLLAKDLPENKPAAPVQLKVLRTGVVTRSRAGYISLPPRTGFPAPAAHSVLMNAALRSPFAAPGIRTRLTAIFSAYSAGRPTVDSVLVFDARDLTFIHQADDTYRGSVHLGFTAFRQDGGSTALLERDLPITLRPSEYRYCLEYGFRSPFQLNLPGPGAWQVRAVVADNPSDRLGSATHFVDIPNVQEGGLALTGISLRGASETAGKAPADPREDPGVRIFKPGRTCTFLTGAFNVLTNAQNQSLVEVRTRIFADGRLVMDGQPKQHKVAEASDRALRVISGQITLDPLMAPGDYLLHLTVRDLLAPPGQQRTATQAVDFQVRP